MSLNTVQNGKGDKCRVKNRRAFESNWDLIQWKSAAKPRPEPGKRPAAEERRDAKPG